MDLGGQGCFQEYFIEYKYCFFLSVGQPPLARAYSGGTRGQCPPPRLELLYLSNLKLKSEELKDQNHDRREVVLILFMLASTFE